jgi:hypothetical protein
VIGKRQKISVLIPQRAQNDTLYYLGNRHIRYQTLICCIAAAGEAYCPLLISANPHATQVFNTGLWDGIKLKIEIAPSPYAHKQSSKSM